MNLYTILGAALADAKFRKLFFENPLKAALTLGIFLTQSELDTLEEVLKIDCFEERLAKAMPCPREPCPLSLARLDHDDQVTLTSAAD